MKQLFLKCFLVAIALTSIVSCNNSTKLPKATEVMAITKRVADWQLKTYEDQGKYRSLPPKDLRQPWHHRDRYPDQDWVPASLFTGVYQFSTIAGDDKYVDWLGQKAKQAGYNLYTRMYHADDHCIGQLYLSLSEKYNNAEYYAPTQKQFDEIMASDKADNWHWFWCDALFMSPPVWVRLSKITGDSRYLDYMDKQYHMTYNRLWNSEESLFYRDNKYKNQYETNGKGIFWSRGNGWVFGGLAMMIPDMPEDWQGREFYINLFKDMAARLKELQREDGTWSAGLLGDIESYPNIETSGSSFFTFGLAWGLNNGILDRETYEPTLLKAWNALVGAVNEDGLFGYVQGVGAAPGASYPDYTELYGVGAFLSAGTQMYHYVNNNKKLIE
ncbi:MAG: glycoside hydrolase family 88 protein [Rikenellaceae bacterium]